MPDHGEIRRPRAKFRAMTEGTQEDWNIIAGEFASFAANGGRRILDHLKLLEGDCGGFPVDRLTHCLQTATRAWRDGRDEEYVVCALIHDIGDILGAYNHPDIAAAILKPFVSEANHWMVEKHGIFQGYYFFHYLGMDRDMREQFRGHPHFERTAEFCEKYDQTAFDPDYDTMPLEAFEPMVMCVFAAPKNTIYVLPENQ
ncbi:HD domain-containing protein [Amphiplicatus metriothermophilus]|uniref:Predicted HD phosphohydrolase n=1 Tax=Amphiplicatus metriothermophilus TaxID=1519374 RepID=A0A239Q0B8_9PROT|nr:phosphohydrolase [Amphiplicatus metriothermophilus]MBB5520073.1 putative HD phosphohydrolase [Amphiplicatus metriothermophilus]SNT75870.1 Predicted HD phosphohydrolase [Amphiplicatus metriothermophilus]